MNIFNKMKTTGIVRDKMQNLQGSAESTARNLNWALTPINMGLEGGLRPSI